MVITENLQISPFKENLNDFIQLKKILYSKIPGEISLPISKEMALGTGGGGCGGGGWAGGGWSGGSRFSLSVEEDPQF